MKRLIAIAILLLVSACSPKPEDGIVLYNQPNAMMAAEAHMKEALGRYFAMPIQGTSMEPLIKAGDWMVADASFPYENLKEGMICIYAPDWTPNLVIHMAAAKSGDSWIMSGLNNSSYEGGGNGNGLHMQKRHYRGKVLKVYTTRSK